MRAVFCLAVTAMSLVFSPNPSLAQEQKLGRITNLPLPRYVSIRSDEAFLRLGPSLEYPIEWVYQRSQLPIRVIGESEHWRKVQTPMGDTGWFHYSLLTNRRTALVTAERVQLVEIPSETSQIVAIVTEGAIGYILACDTEWCQLEFELDGEEYTGWLRKDTFWGSDTDEVLKPSS